MKDYLVFWVGDGGDSESYSVFHSNIISAKSSKLAIREYVKERNLLKDDDEELNEIEYEYYDTLLCSELRI